MIVYAWHLEWYAWIGAMLLAFLGAGRLGEVLKCAREDLVLPGDVVEAEGTPVFLRLRTFKSRLRQPAKV
jgi:putative Mn2+ efflux pump MntP